MPGGDRTGPSGGGPLTGRRMGNCAGTENAGSGLGFGRGFFRRAWGSGRGYGFGRGFGFYGSKADPDPSDENAINDEINVIKNRLQSLEKLLGKNKTGD